ncbi:hypothetical protein F9C07_1633658 [Aspergillus flavus]|uniref:Uncharacterized protein n=1 Tax=Aspergillus flavus (strain ATCC 200026 / FGSC A1120 / IAM 13836 / NRRL 3357 / JCM 12722 / SRRC 167) TaxID=332952 RepID=A0A7U2MHC1_ASPFN|nr:hypothetical protein F9C07_1633658 [Aspergillus flavus]
MHVRLSAYPKRLGRLLSIFISRPCCDARETKPKAAGKAALATPSRTLPAIAPVLALDDGGYEFDEWDGVGYTVYVVDTLKVVETGEKNDRVAEDVGVDEAERLLAAKTNAK